MADVRSVALVAVQPEVIIEAMTRPPQDRLERPTVDVAADDALRTVFWVLAVLGLVLLVGLSFGSGINADDRFQVDYSRKLVDYYSTLGRDRSALNIPDGDMQLYGGFFEVVAGFANKALGFQEGDMLYHAVRHASSAVLGWVAILCTGLLVRLVAGGQAGIIALLLLLCSPRFVGHSLMNPKDIPFAAGTMMTLYHMVAVLNRMPNPGRWNLVGLAGGLALALAMRAGGLLPFAYVGMFAGLHFLLKNGGIAALSNARLLGRYALVVGGVWVVGYAAALLFWPYALQDPLHHPLNALTHFTDLEVRIRVLYDGHNAMSDQTPWHYPVKWILYTIPVATLAGLVGFLVSLPRLLKRYDPLWVWMLPFVGLFPVFYVIVTHAVIHDGWRHLTFVYPPLVAAASLFWNELARQAAARKPVLRYAVFGALALSLVDSAAYIAANPRYPYTYFNPIVGRIQGAFGRFETDYWGVSTRQGIEWMEQQGILATNMQQPVTIATNMSYSTEQLVARYGDKVKVKYLRWTSRCDDTWDYALYPTRFIEATALQRGFWPPDNTVHVVEANGVPLLAVMKDNGKNCALGVAAARAGDLPSAVAYLRTEVVHVPDNELAWAALAGAYLGLDSLEAGRQAAERCMTISPADAAGNNWFGLYFLKKGDLVEARAQFERAVQREPTNGGAFYYLGLIAWQQGDGAIAMNNVMSAIEIAPTFKPAYDLAAQICDSTGNPEMAEQFREAARQIK